MKYISVKLRKSLDQLIRSYYVGYTSKEELLKMLDKWSLTDTVRSNAKLFVEELFTY